MIWALDLDDFRYVYVEHFAFAFAFAAAAAADAASAFCIRLQLTRKLPCVKRAHIVQLYTHSNSSHTLMACVRACARVFWTFIRV